VVVFHPDAVKDPSTYDDPHHYAEGVSDVLVRGIPVIRDHQLTSARPGGPLRRRVSAKP
jgi:N-acyl-D-amino-acid deacylase